MAGGDSEELEWNNRFRPSVEMPAQQGKRLLILGMFRRLSHSLCVHGISKQTKPEHETTTDFFSAMNAIHHRNDIRSLSALRPSFSSPS